MLSKANHNAKIIKHGLKVEHDVVFKLIHMVQSLNVA
jgi:hypothetical protein